MQVDAAAFVVVDWEARRIRPAAAWFLTPEVERALAPILERRYDPDHPGITEEALERDRPLLLRSVEDWAGQGRLRERLLHDYGEEQAALTWCWYTRASAISCPVRTSEGRALGVLSISSTPPLPPLDEDALHAVGVSADLAAIAIDRAQLLRAEECRMRRELALSEAGRAVAESLELRVVYRRIVEQARAITGATRVQLTRWRDELEQLESVAALGFADEAAIQRFRRGEGTIGRVVDTRAPYRSRPEDRERFLERVVGRERIASFVHVPIELGPRLFGVLSAGHQREGFFGDADVEQLLKFSRLAAAAIANAADYQHERRVARALTRGFIPSEPGRLPGIELGVRYEPSERQPTGGDVYGAWPKPAGEVALLVGDVSGRGLEVSGLAAMVRFFVEARSLERSSPAEVLREANALLRVRLPPETFVTAFFGFVRGGELRYCNAGHVAPLLVGAGGAVRELEGTSLPLGLEDEPADAVAPLAPGDLLFAYTDGLAEARRDGEQFGAGELRRCVVAQREAPTLQACVDAVYGRALAWAGVLDDDVTLLAVRRSLNWAGAASA